MIVPKKRYQVKSIINGLDYDENDKWLISRYYDDLELGFYNKEVFMLINNEKMIAKVENPKRSRDVVLNQLLSIYSTIELENFIISPYYIYGCEVPEPKRLRVD